jgi:signal transduction histidine kinase
MSTRAQPVTHVAQVELALLDTKGVIAAVNDAWLAFSADNGGDPARTGVGMSYLDICDRAGDLGSIEVGASIRAALSGELPAPVLVTIPCDALGVPRRFDVLVSSRFDDEGSCIGAAVTLSLRKDDDRHWVPAGRDRSDHADHLASLLTRIEDRERIAVHLNDVVMSGLLSIGIGLQGMEGGLIRPEDKARLAQYVESLDGIVREIRTTVFELAPTEPQPIGLKHRLLEVVDASGLNSQGTSVEFFGPLDSDVGGDLGDSVVEVVRAALTHAVQHSRASMVHISVALSASLITVRVSDDGTANGDAIQGAALRRLRQFATQSGGDLQVTTGVRGGTQLRWTARLNGD